MLIETDAYSQNLLNIVDNKEYRVEPEIFGNLTNITF